MSDQRVNQVFELTNWPRDPRVREYLFDIYRTREPKMWVEIGDVKIDLFPHDFRPRTEPFYHWFISGNILRFSARPQHKGRSFQLLVPMVQSVRRPTFVINQIPMDPNKKCECCDDGTVYECHEDGYYCPACKHTRLPIRLGDLPKVHGKYPPMCPECGRQFIEVGNFLSCEGCGLVRSR